MTNKAHKARVVIEYLLNGGELNYKGRTLVYLDNYLMKEIAGIPYGIDGLAIKGVSINTKDNSESPTYMGYNMSFMEFLRLVEELSEEDYNLICAYNILKDVHGDCK